MARYPIPKRVQSKLKDRARKRARRQTRDLQRQTERRVANIGRRTDRQVRVARNTFARESERVGNISLA